MSDANREVCIRLNQEVFGQGRVELVDELVAPDFREHAAPPGTPTGPDAVRATVRFIHGGIDDISYDIEDSVVEGDSVVLRVTMHGTHAREFFGVPGTGKRFTMQQIHIFRLAGGKVTDHWATRDDLGMMRQIGALG
ncbi:MAG TPA: ester cyclase [Solirubrobacteraceae bacterium]|jgi:steroid delta-isomerase-like uncharacterized protein